MNKYLGCIAILLFASTSLCAQSLQVTQPFQAIPNSSVLASYKNQFGSWEQGDSFPYAVIRVGLEGDANQVVAAKQLLHLMCNDGTTETAVYKGMQNELLFLVPTSAQHIDITCGTECTQQTILQLAEPLQTNTVYMGRVSYTPKEIQRIDATTSQKQTFRQFFRFYLSPADAIVTVEVDGVQEVWQTRDGYAYKLLNHGTYPYSIVAEGHFAQQGTIVVSDESREMVVNLIPIQ